MRPARRLLLLVCSLALFVAACGQAPVAEVPPGGAEEPASTTPPSPVEPPPPTPPPAPAPEPPAPAAPVAVATTVIATGLEAPWSIAFTPDGQALVTERDSGRLLSVTADGTVSEVAQLPADGVGEGGLLGVAVSPDFATDGLVYAYLSTAQDNRVVRFQLGQEPEPILTGIPVNRIHNGGRLAFGPDGFLYVTTGDATESGLAQDPAALAGKILRLTPDGQPAPGNPIEGNPMFSMGHRNVQGLAWTADGQLFATEFGQNTFDEVNRIEPGGNYGWPEVEGVGGDPAFIDPVVTWDPAEASPSGAAILDGGAIPQFEGDLFAAGLRGQRLWRVDLAPDNGVAGLEPLLTEEFGRLRDVVQAPDGSLWILTSNRDGRGDPVADDDRIIRLGPAAG